MHLRLNVGETKTVRLKRVVGGVDTPIQEGLQWSWWHGFPAPAEFHQNRDGTLSVIGVRPGFVGLTVIIGGWIPEKFREIGSAVTVGQPAEDLTIEDLSAPALLAPIQTTYWPGPTLTH